MAKPSSNVDPKSGFCSETNVYHSIRPAVTLPPESTPMPLASFLLSLLNTHPPPPDAAAIVDAVTGRRILYSDFLLRIKTLANSLAAKFKLSKGDVAFILSPNSINIPVLCLSLLSLGIVISPSNPTGTEREIRHQVGISKPVIAFATSDSALKIPSIKHGTVILDSAEFESLLTSTHKGETKHVKIKQSDAAAILYSSGTTGTVKGVMLSHRNWIASLAGANAVRKVTRTAAVMCTVPYFHVYGFRYMITALAMGETLVFVTGRFDLRVMLKAIQELRVSHVAMAPPVLSILASDGSDSIMDGYDLSSLKVVGCGGAHLTRAVIHKFKKRLPKVQLAQVRYIYQFRTIYF